ncbi:MAG: mechanosensitive ion channel [Deltaproteobacteria bacterium]|nr:mechanosensitive ion channel [Deltaproteobacteria bacterium]
MNIDLDEAMVDDRLGFIERRLTASRSRVESLLSTIELGVLRIQKKTLAFRRELDNLRAELTEQERLTAQDMRNKGRLVDLVERYGAGDWVARHIKVELERFRHRRQRNAAGSTDEESLRRRLREHRQALFELGTLLFRVDADARDYARALAAEKPSARESAELDRILGERKGALQAQERVLDALAEYATRLADLKREREDELESLYTLVLDRMLWLRNREPLGLLPPNWAFLGQAVDGAVALSARVYGLFQLERRMAQGRFSTSWWPWAAAVLVFGLVPWLALRTRRFLRGRLADHRARGSDAPAYRGALLLALLTAVWPVYIVLVTLALPQFGLSESDSLGPVVVEALQLTALVLWIALFGAAVFGAGGHGERRWGLTLEAGGVLRGSLAAGCVAALVLLIPRYVLLNSPGDDVAASLALARLLMIAFALLVLLLAAVGFSRRRALMRAVLGPSRAHDGFLWSVWPLVHLLAVTVLGATIALNLLGYQYASQFLWQRIMGSGLLALAVCILSFYLKGAVRALWRGVIAGRVGSDPEGGAADGGPLRVLVDLPLAILGAVALLEVWGFSVLEFLGTPAGETMLARAALIALVIVLGIALVRLSNAAVLSLLRPRVLDRVGSREAGRKLQTLGPLAQTSVKLLVVLVGALLILQLVGVETGPLLAGVGIFGLAVGFAAQSLIKDIINGLFILTEGSVGAGDVVDVGGVTGVVEKVTLRSVRIRDLGGNVHFVPNSTIEHVENMTKDFSRYLLDVGVGYREDTDEVVAVMKEVDESMRQDTQFRRDMLEPIEIMGVDRFEDSAVIVRGRLKTRPSQQWRIGREYNRRLKKAFDERGIEIPFPHRTVYWGETKQGQLPLQVENRAAVKAADPREAEEKQAKEEEVTLGTRQLKTEP